MVGVTAALPATQMAVFKTLLASADRNKDGDVTRSEAEASRKILPARSKLAGSQMANAFSALDRDRNGQLGPTEMAILLAAQEEQGVETAASPPTSNAPSASALTASSPPPAQSVQTSSLVSKIAQLAQTATDKNSDGVLSKDELEKSRKRLGGAQALSGSDLSRFLSSADANKDKKLSPGEIKVYLASASQATGAVSDGPAVVGPNQGGSDEGSTEVAPIQGPPQAGSGPVPFPLTGPYKTDKLGAISVWGMAGEPQSAEKPYSINSSGGVLRIEAHQGDRRQKSSEINRAIERSEVSFPANPFEFGKTYDISFSMMFEGGAKSSADNDKFFQIHNVNDPGDGSLGPIFAMQLEGERMRIVTRSDPSAETTSRVKDNWIFEDTQNIVRDKWYNFDIKLRVDPFGKGLVSVTRDGQQIANYEGPVGYNDAKPPYAKVGVYRDTAPEAQVRLYKDMSFKAIAG